MRKAGKPRHHIRPRVEALPDGGEIRAFLSAERIGDAEMRQRVVQHFPVQHVDGRVGARTVADPFHCGLIAAAPFGCECVRIDSDVVRGKTFAGLPRNAVAPIHQRAENVEDEGFFKACSGQ